MQSTSEEIVVQEQNKKRVCSLCKVEKDLESEFDKALSKPRGCSYLCKKCGSDRDRKRKRTESPIDFVGKKYPNNDSYITILQDLGTRKVKSGNRLRMLRYFLIRCDCNLEKEVRSSCLKAGKTASCGRPSCQYSAKGRSNKNSVILEDTQYGFRLTNTQLNRIKAGAEQRKLDFSLTPQDILEKWKEQEGRCYYTGLKLSMGKTTHDTKNNTWSVDRLDNDWGYQKDNFIIVHKALNMMRGTMSVKAFITAAILVGKQHDKYKEKVLSLPEENINDMFYDSVARIMNGKGKSK